MSKRSSESVTEKETNLKEKEEHSKEMEKIIG